MKKITIGLMFLAASTLAPAQNMRVLNAFKQAAKTSGTTDRQGNCTSIAVIKSAIDLYGVGNIFRMTGSAGKYFVMLRSGRELVLTQAEMAQGIAATGFRQFDFHPDAITIKRYADTCFAVMAKHLQETPDLQPANANYSTYDKALADLNDGLSIPSGVTLLGLKKETIRSSTRRITQNGNAMMGNIYHAVYTSNTLYDEAGAHRGIASIRSFKFKRAGRKCFLLFCGPNESYVLKELEP